jgi:hypothetical protein
MPCSSATDETFGVAIIFGNRNHALLLVFTNSVLTLQLHLSIFPPFSVLLTKKYFSYQAAKMVKNIFFRNWPI